LVGTEAIWDRDFGEEVEKARKISRSPKRFAFGSINCSPGKIIYWHPFLYYGYKKLLTY